MNNEDRPERIAVIAIHGVGDHPPQEMARAASSLLESLASGEPDGSGRYETFEENLVRIDVQGMKESSAPVNRSLAGSDKEMAWGPMDRLRQAQKQARGQPAQKRFAPAGRQLSIDHLFMQEQLRNYQGRGPEDIYECLRLDGTRRPTQGLPKKTVHIYDMFWSDLSGVNKTGLRVFGELYQILFHLGSVGVNNVAAAAYFFGQTEMEWENQPREGGASVPKKKGLAEKWDQFTRWQRQAAGALAFWIALMNLLILICAVAVFITAAFSALAPQQQSVTATLIPIVAIFAGLSYLRSRSTDDSPWSYRAPVVLVLLAILVTALAMVFPEWAYLIPGPQAAQWIVAGAAFGLALLGADFIVIAYNKRRPGARRRFWALFAAWVPLTVASWIRVPWCGDSYAVPWCTQYYAIDALLRGADVGFWMLAGLWLFFSGAMLGASWFGRAAVRAVRNEVPNEGDRASRVNWTARLTIVLPGLIFLLVTFAAWAGLLHACLPLLRGSIYYSPLLGELKPAQTWADESFYNAGIDVLPLMLLLTGIALLIALYAVTPSVIGELNPPTLPDLRNSVRLGNWLKLGLEFMRIAGRSAYVAVLLFPPLMIVLLIANRSNPVWLANYRHWVTPLTDALGAIVGGSALGLLAFGGRLSKLTGGLRTGVRVALDVDNWLREHPEGTNPTARICARYVSLLRHIAQWRDADNNGYDRLVIFAHSQGTVITADLLRFIRVEVEKAGCWEQYDRALGGLEGKKISLVTVGCPLRQLYGLRFPYIYGFAGDHVLPCDDPHPKDLQLLVWINAYRTGDYVGRYLWRHDDPWVPASALCPDSWEAGKLVNSQVFVSADGRHLELAIGPGAHTHYWDHTGKQTGEILDAAIAHATWDFQVLQHP